jgi:tetratricopeptide (TPR) repeat protein
VPVDREAVLRSAERLLRQGRLDGAIAEYVRLTDDQPRDWNSINSLGDLYVRAGDTGRAVSQFVRIGDHLFDEGFLPKAAALYKKALKVKNDHEHTLLRLSEIAARQGLLADAKLYLRQLQQQRQNRGDGQGVLACVLRLGEIDEDDADAKMAAARAAQAMGNTGRAVALLHEAATAFEKQKKAAEAVDALIAATELAPDDVTLRDTVARTLLAAGQMERAQPFLTAATVGENPDLLLAIARQDLMSGRSSEGHAGLMRAIALAPDREDQVAQLADELLAAERVDDAYGCVEVLVDAALFEAAFGKAAQVLESFLARRRVIPGLLKLVDVYLDAGLAGRVTSVQEHLADAYLQNDQAAEARVVAEDLIAREPHVDAHVDRLRRALVALGVEDIEDVIARQREIAPVFDELLELTPDDLTFDDLTPSDPPEAQAPPDAPAPVVSEYREPVIERFEQPEPAPEPITRAPAREIAEIDLSGMLSDLKAGAPAKVPAAAKTVASEGAAADPSTLFERAQEHLRRGEAAEAAAALQAAAASPQLRFKATAQLGRLSVARGDLHGAIDWLEQAASAPAPSADEANGVIYDLADALERSGEHVRALALFMELEADAGAFRDIELRIDQLTRATTGVNGDRT